MTHAHVLPFDAPADAASADLDSVGGKGLSLARLTAAGFAVPAGFTVTTAAYRHFVSDDDLQQDIIDLAKPELVGTAVSFDSASERIQALFAEAELTDELKAQIGSAYTAFGAGEPPVAVRSSANAEDLPDLSFAGQQDTYLNIRGRDALFEAVRDCWASLWTARAISYRHDHAIAQEAVAMAVVVQVMVPSEVSGILFAANPATGERSEMIVNASFGLGEAERHFGQPQDIEWAVANGKLWLLQSRPITNLPPAPLKDVRWEKPDMPAWVHNTPLLRKNLVEHIPGPVSPLFEDLYLKDAVGGRAAHGVHYAVNGYAYWTAGTPGWGKTANDAASDSLNGNACSPGQITVRASLVMSPADFAKMQPGTILVCPMTTPAWTQLFSQAKGLVTDIGSILTHGSIVAREYNIPAVLGLGIATKRIRHGQMIRVDGDNGVVALLDD